MYSKQELDNLDRAVVQAERLDVPGVSNAVRWLILGAAKCPTVDASIAPIMAYAREV